MVASLIIISLFMLVQFQKQSCLKHNLPLTMICSNLSCKCDGRLCQKCAKEHSKVKEGEDELFKESVYFKKVQIQTQIVLKQYKHYEQYKAKDKDACLLNSKNQQSVKNVEALLKLINQEKKSVFGALEEFNFNHYEVKKKLNKIKSIHPGPYLASLKNSYLSTIVVRLLNEVGLQRLRKKVLSAHAATQKYQEFLNAVKKYGSSPLEFLEGLGWKEKHMLRYSLGLLLSEWRGNKKVEICLDQGRINYNLARPRKNSESKDKVEQSPRRRINVFTGQVYRINSGKEN